MQDFQPLGKLLIVSGIFMTVIGLILWSGVKIPKIPGDIAIEKENFRFYFPLATSLIVSIILTFIFWLLRKS